MKLGKVKMSGTPASAAGIELALKSVTKRKEVKITPAPDVCSGTQGIVHLNFYLDLG